MARRRSCARSAACQSVQRMGWLVPQPFRSPAFEIDHRRIEIDRAIAKLCSANEVRVVSLGSAAAGYGIDLAAYVGPIGMGMSMAIQNSTHDMHKFDVASLPIDS